MVAAGRQGALVAVVVASPGWLHTEQHRGPSCATLAEQLLLGAYARHAPSRSLPRGCCSLCLLGEQLFARTNLLGLKQQEQPGGMETDVAGRKRRRLEVQEAKPPPFVFGQSNAATVSEKELQEGGSIWDGSTAAPAALGATGRRDPVSAGRTSWRSQSLRRRPKRQPAAPRSSNRQAEGRERPRTKCTIKASPPRHVTAKLLALVRRARSSQKLLVVEACAVPEPEALLPWSDARRVCLGVAEVRGRTFRCELMRVLVATVRVRFHTHRQLTQATARTYSRAMVSAL